MLNKILLAVASALILASAGELIKWVEKRLKDEDKDKEKDKDKDKEKDNHKD